MPQDNKPIPPANVKLSDLTTNALKARFVSDFGYDQYALLVNADVKARKAAAKQAREDELAKRRSR
jgi:hypothetical protein